MNMLFRKLQMRSAFSTLLCTGALFSTMAVTNIATAAENDDPMLKAMQAELEREKSQLVLQDMQRPFFIEYRMDDIGTYEAVANYGALIREESGHQRIIRVTVRVGNYSLDSSTGRGEGTVQLAPSDNDPDALRYALWSATDEAYKNALRAYSTKEAALKRFQSPRAEQDFAPAKPVTHIAPLVTLDIDRNEWKKRIIDASSLFASDPEVKTFAEHVQYSTSNVRGLAMNRYLVNTEGTVVRQGYTGYSAMISVGGQASDGQVVARDNGTTAAEAKDLESASAFHKRVIDDLKSLEALRNAPLVAAEDYHGPVLFSGDAATDVFTRVFVPGIEAERPELGTTARTNGTYNTSYKSRVLPEMLTITDDPLQTKFEGKRLLGAYEVDDEGVPAQSVDIVSNGTLQNYLIGREPIKDFPASNGHGRAAPAQAAHARVGVLIVKSKQTVPAAELDKKLVQMAKDRGTDVYAVETMGGNEITPRLLYRVHSDGTRQLVRGAAFDEVDTRTLRSDIVAVGDDPYVANSLGVVPQTTIVPSLLFDNVGVKRATEEQQKLPYYAPPAMTGK